ncbi:MAG TPA: DUF4282 domain-containing protein [Caulobacteraceae bacterium]|nr:DUF4282 domain-containing protein [Caulobacteraceae bacterium]
MRAPTPSPRPADGRTSLFWDMLTFDRLMTGPVIHLIYWCGLGLVALFGFTVIGAAVGVAIRGGSLEGALLAIPVLVAGFLVIGALVLLWRGACEFYMAIFRIAEDLRVLRGVAERRAANAARPRATTAPPTRPVA